MLVYQTQSPGEPSRLYKVNRQGESTLLSGAAGEASVERYAISPDTGQLAFVYGLAAGQSGLAVIDLATGEAVRPTLMIGGAVVSPQWLPDSQGLLYSVADSQGITGSLFLVRPLESDPVKLVETDPATGSRLAEVAVSADSSRAAVLISEYGPTDSDVPTFSSLYLLDLAAAAEPALVADTTGDANTFGFSWSPAGRQLLYQQRQYIGLTFIGNRTWFPAGPLVVLGADGIGRAIADYEDNLQLHWLDAQRILVAFFDRFDVLTADGRQLATHTRVGEWQVVPSPDGTLLAFLDRTADNTVAAHVLSLDTGEARIAGQASSLFLRHQSFDDSVLHWSPDGLWLAWNRKMEGDPTVAEFYAHEISTGNTRLLTTNFAGFPGYSPWLPEGHTPGYPVRAGAVLELTVTDLDSGSAIVIGEAADSLTCYPSGAWASNHKVLWDSCGDGVYLSRIAGDGAVTGTRVLDRDTAGFALTDNRQIALMQPLAQGGDGSPDGPVANRFIYDFIEQRLMELGGTQGDFEFDFLQ